MIDPPSPWLARELFYERQRRHARVRAALAPIVQRVAAGCAASAVTVLILKSIGALP